MLHVSPARSSKKFGESKIGQNANLPLITPLNYTKPPKKCLEKLDKNKHFLDADLTKSLEKPGKPTGTALGMAGARPYFRLCFT